MQLAILITAFLPYCSLVLRLPTDVQPWAALISWIYWLIAARNRSWKVRLNGWDLILFAFCCYFLLYFYVDGEVSLFAYLRKNMVFLLSIAILWVARDFRIPVMRKALVFAAFAYTGFAVLQYLSTPAYVALAGLFTRLKNIHIGNRGAASLAPEATDFGLTMVYVVLFALILKRRDGSNTRILGINAYSLVIGLGLICIVLSRSGTGFIGVAVVGGLAFLSLTARKRYAVWAVLGLGAAVFTLAMLPEHVIQNTRGLHLLFSVFSGAEFLFTTSFAHRSIHNIVSWIALFESYGLGYGAGSFTTVAPDIYERYGLATQFGMSNWHQEAVRVTLGSGALAVTALLVTEFGVAGILFIAIVFLIVWNSRLPYRSAILALMAMTWLQSFPAAYPMFWILIGLARNPAFSPPPASTAVHMRSSHPAESGQTP